MSKYLVVTHQTALSPALQQTVRTLAAGDAAAEFAVLVPEAPSGATTWEGETVDGAKQRAEAAKTLFEDTAQARVFRTAVGRVIRCRRSPTSCSRNLATRPWSSAHCLRAYRVG
jgi:hypothetical protein